jgi:protein ImuB
VEIACVIDCRLAAPERPGRSGGLRPGRDFFDDPVAAGELTETIARALEGIGAAVETGRLGEVFFAVGGLRGLHGGEVEGVIAAARTAIEGAGVGAAGRDGRGDDMASAGTRLGSRDDVAAQSVLIGVGPTRTAARGAAERGLPPVTPPRLLGFLGSLPTSTLVDRSGDPRRAGDLVVSLERLGIGTLGALRQLTVDQVADRFGPIGLRAWRIARGEEEPLRPRVPRENLVEEIERPEGIAGSQLDRAVELLVDRLLASPIRKGRTLLGVRLGARLCGGGSWSVDQGLGRPTAAASALRRLLVPRLEQLPGPAEALRLRALGFGPPAADQLVMETGGAEPRRRRLGAAVREVRATQGAEALLRVLPVDAGSRIPERRHLLTPFPET